MIKVLIVDDSQLLRQLLTRLLASDPTIEVVGSACDPFDARDKIKQLQPDVITLDVEMPRMDGITFLKNLMRLRPMPVVMISTLTERGASTTLEALALGAVDYIAKPKAALADQLQLQAAAILRKVKLAAKANIHNLVASCQNAPTRAVLAGERRLNQRIDLLAIGASTGGTEATRQILQALPAEMPPVLITQHMPASFTAAYAERLNRSCELTVEEFNQQQQRLQPGHVYVAHGDYHMRIEKQGADYCAIRDDGDRVNRHKPAVDVLFNSIASCAGHRAVGVLLTGMGIDGAHGLGQLRATGAATIAQDQQSSVVWGMPRTAVEQDAASQVLPLDQIAGQLIKHCYA